MIEENTHITDGDLAEYLDGDLDLARRSGVAAHLALCRECQARSAQIGTGRTAIHALPEKAASTLSWEQVSEGLGTQVAPKMRRVSAIRWAVAASILFVSIAVSLSLWNASQAPPEGIVTADGSGAQSVDLGLYLADLDQPEANSLFASEYRVQPASWEQAVQSAGVEASGPLERIPSEYEFSEAHLVEKDGWPTASLAYRGPFGRVVVFCRKSKVSPVFSGFETKGTWIEEKRCTSVLCKRYQAISFSTEEGVFTVVGERGQSLETLVAAMW